MAKLKEIICWRCPGCGTKALTDETRPVCKNAQCHYGARQTLGVIPAFSIYALIEQGYTVQGGLIQ